MLVSSESELIQALEKSKNITLNVDIYISEDFDTITEFDGRLDGQGNTIYGLKTQFIKKITENAVIKNITFKDIKMNGESIFQFNAGTIDSVTIQNLTTSLAKTKNSGLVYVNTGKIVNCEMSNSQIKSIKSSAGLVYKTEENGKILDCTIKNSSIQSIKYFASGLCSETVNSTVKNCILKNIKVSGKKSQGVTEEPASSTFKNISVSNSKIHSKEKSIGLTIGLHNSMHNCSLKNSQIIGSDISLMGGKTTKDCYSKNCTVKVLSSQNKIELFGFNRSETQNCFVKSLSIYGEEISFQDNTNTFENSYVQAKLISKEGTFENISNRKRLHYDLTIERPNPKTVHIKDKSDFKNIERTDTIKLQTDIHLDDEETLETPTLFTGKLIGNGHTISNLKQPLFLFLKGNVSNLYIKNLNPQITNSISGLSETAEHSKIQNVHFSQQTPVNTNIEIEFNSLINNSYHTTIQNCTATVNLKTSNNNISKIAGLVRYIVESKVQNCNVILKTHKNVTKKIDGLAERIISGNINRCYTTGHIINNKFGVNINGLISHINGIGEKPEVTNNISNIHMTQNYTNGGQYIPNSGLVGFNDKGIVKNCKFTGVIQGHINRNGKILHCGGICRENTGEIKNCVNTGTIQYSTDGYTKNTAIGGISATTELNSKIENCINSGDIKGIEKVGGIVGELTNTLKHVINTGNISSNDTAGGLIGEIIKNTDSKIKYGYNNGSINAKNKSDALIGINHASNIQSKKLFWQTNKKDSNFGTETTENTEKIKLLFKI